jgi:hypothetical protein
MEWFTKIKEHDLNGNEEYGAFIVVPTIAFLFLTIIFYILLVCWNINSTKPIADDQER